MYFSFEKNGDLIIPRSAGLGKQYGFLDRLRGIGMGSSKMIYQSGLTKFDQINDLTNDIPHVNIEPTTKGFILRLNKSNRLSAWGTSYDQIIKIVLIKPRYEEDGLGQLLIETEEAKIQLQIYAVEIRYFVNYLHSKTFEKVKAKISIEVA